MRRVTGARRHARAGGIRLLTWADRLVLYVVIGAALLLMLVPHGSGAAVVHIVGEGGYDVVASLDANREFHVPGPLGITVVDVREGSVRIVSSPCPQKLCVSMGTVDSPGGAAVCVPNRVVVTVEGGASPADGRGPTDAVTR